VKVTRSSKNSCSINSCNANGSSACICNDCRHNINNVSISPFEAKRQKGVALVVVLLIVALVAILATQMVGRLQLNVVRAQNIKDNNQAYWYALGAEEFARKSIRSLIELSPDSINLSQPWAQEFEYPVPDGSITARLYDMQSCFNLNAINSVFDTDEPITSNSRLPSQQAFHNLLAFVIPDSFTVDTLTDSLIDWIDEDDNPSNFGAEDADYESLSNPYLAANNPMSSKSELRLLNGIQEAVNEQWVTQLQPLVCVLPEENLRLNVNTVTVEQAQVLAALLGDTLDNAQNIISDRPETGFDSLADFTSLPAVAALNLSASELDWFAIDTKYFKLVTTGRFNGAQFTLSSLMQIEEDAVTVVRREFGEF